MKKSKTKTSTHRCNLTSKELNKLDVLRPFWKEEEKIEFIPLQMDKATKEFLEIVKSNEEKIKKYRNQLKFDLG